MATIEIPAFERLSAPICRVGESPLWCTTRQLLWWVDIEGYALLCHDPASGKTQSWTTPQRTGCVALLADGVLLAAMETGLFRLLPGADGKLGCELLVEAPHARPDMRFNDGRCDRSGRFWVSSMVRDAGLAAPAGWLYRFDGEGLLQAKVAQLITGNGLAFSPVGDKLYLSDSHPSVQRIWVFDMDEEGGLHNRREFVDMNHYPGRPDGAAVDVDGCYWICANDAGALLRFTPQGRLDRHLQLPFAKPSMCAFGGPQLDQLFVTSIRPAAHGTGEPVSNLAGSVVVLRPGTSGLAEVPCRAPQVAVSR